MASVDFGLQYISLLGSVPLQQLMYEMCTKRFKTFWTLRLGGLEPRIQGAIQKGNPNLWQSVDFGLQYISLLDSATLTADE